MRFDDFDREMRAFEQSMDQYVSPDVYLVARLDGRSFSKLTKETCDFEAPFDIRFRDLMEKTTRSLMEETGFRILFGYTQSDEISLLFHPLEQTFARKVRKINTSLAGEASATFSMALGIKATFDCRVVPLPDLDRVTDYFLWRQEDACRNALNGYCYWTLRKDGVSVGQATSMLKKQGVDMKTELLLQHGIDFHTVPTWQKYGIGLREGEIEKEGFDPIRQESVKVKRRVILLDEALPQGEAYRKYIRGFLAETPGKLA